MPFCLIYIFNWIVFFVIFISLLRKWTTSVTTGAENSKSKKILQQLLVAASLSTLFGLGWGLGLFVTDKAYPDGTKFIQTIVTAVFIVLTAFHGLFIFLMHCLRSEEVRSLWKRWVCCRFQSSNNSSSLSYYKNQNKTKDTFDITNKRSNSDSDTMRYSTVKADDTLLIKKKSSEMNEMEMNISVPPADVMMSFGSNNKTYDETL